MSILFREMSCSISRQAQASVYPGIPSPTVPLQLVCRQGPPRNKPILRQKRIFPTNNSLPHKTGRWLPSRNGSIRQRKKRTPGLPHWRLYLFPLRKTSWVWHWVTFLDNFFEVSLPTHDGGTNIAKMNCSQLFGEFFTFLVTSFFYGKTKSWEEKNCGLSCEQSVLLQFPVQYVAKKGEERGRRSVGFISHGLGRILTKDQEKCFPTSSKSSICEAT